jgi:hypothetical protein
MVKKHFKYRMKGGMWQKFKTDNPKSAFSVKAIIVILVIIGVFVGTWAALGFSTSLDSISIALLAAEILYIVFLLPWVYWKMLRNKNTGFGTEPSYTQGLNKPFFPQWGINWFGFLTVIGLWVGIGMAAAAIFSIFNGTYESNIIKGIATAGLIFVLAGSIDVFRSVGMATGKVLLGGPIIPIEDPLIDPVNSNTFNDNEEKSKHDEEDLSYYRDSSMFSHDGSNVNLTGGRKRRSSSRRR